MLFNLFQFNGQIKKSGTLKKKWSLTLNSHCNMAKGRRPKRRKRIYKYPFTTAKCGANRTFLLFFPLPQYVQHLKPKNELWPLAFLVNPTTSCFLFWPYLVVVVVLLVSKTVPLLSPQGCWFLKRNIPDFVSSQITNQTNN